MSVSNCFALFARLRTSVVKLMRQPSWAIGSRVVSTAVVPMLLCVLFSRIVGLSSLQAEDAAVAKVEGPLSVDESLKQFRLHPDCVIEIVAAEPDVVDPVHIAFDPVGRMWVVEYSDYPHGPKPGEPGRSRIRVLTDDDGDGRYEKPVTFAEGLTFATGLLHWRDGVIVTTGTAVLFLRDTDGDGKADETQEWFRGFKEENPQLRANHPTLAMDNYVYIASGLRGGDVGPGADWAKAFRKEQSEADQPLPAPVSLSGRDFRFDPLTGAFEAVSGPGQFGLAFDDWGNRFVCDNRHPCKHIVLEERYLKRNPDLRVAATFHDVAAQGEQSRLYPLSRAWTTSNLHAHQFTAACGLCIYRSDLIPEEFRGNAFICDPTANLVHREVLTPRGGTFDSRPGREGVEFLATADEWFRPVNLTVGPDAGLYIVDMYRAVIEHPQFMPDELKSRPDLLLGTDKGRIWRVKPATTSSLSRSSKSEVSVPSSATLLTTASRPSVSRSNDFMATEIEGSDIDAPPGERHWSDWTHFLESPLGWQRDTAHHLLLTTWERVGPSLQELAINSHSPQARAHAVWLLHGRRQLSDSLLLSVLQDADPRVVEQAVRVAALRGQGLAAESQLAVVERLNQLALQTPDAALQLAVALALPEFQRGRPESGLTAILSRQQQASWITDAVATAPVPLLMKSLRQRVDSRTLRQTNRFLDATQSAHCWSRLYEFAGQQETDERLSHLLVNVTDPVEMTALSNGVRRRGKRFTDLVPGFTPEAQSVVATWLGHAQELALDDSIGATPKRITAIEALEHDLSERAIATFLQLSSPSHPSEVRIAAIDGLAAFNTTPIDDRLLTRFTGEPPMVRSAIVRAMTASVPRVTVLLDAIEAGTIPPTLVDVATTNRLKANADGSIKSRANKLFATSTPAARQEVLAKYQSCLTLPSDPLRGRAVFQKNCIACHRIGDLGVDVAPDISDSRTKTAEYLLTHILDPNRAIDNNYFSYTVVDKEGRQLTGVLSSETATSITLKQPEGKVVVLSRSDIELLQASGVSLMPEGLEKNIPPEQMADLISFIKNWRYLDGAVPKEVIR
ncbi:MAG: c-type cytochrome [Planctomycetaceae bacterium]